MKVKLPSAWHVNGKTYQAGDEIMIGEICTQDQYKSYVAGYEKDYKISLVQAVMASASEILDKEIEETEVSETTKTKRKTKAKE